MTANAVVRARIDERIKEEASTVLAAMGLTVSDAFRIMLTRIANEKALPFEPLAPNKTTVAAMREARKGLFGLALPKIKLFGGARIPQPGGQESLNVAAAAAICLYEQARRGGLQ